MRRPTRSSSTFADAMTCYAFAEAHWTRMRSTNGLEHLHGEIERRTLAVGPFPDRASALRLTTVLAPQVTSTWSDRLYLDMSLLTNHHGAGGVSPEAVLSRQAFTQKSDLTDAVAERSGTVCISILEVDARISNVCHLQLIE